MEVSERKQPLHYYKMQMHSPAHKVWGEGVGLWITAHILFSDSRCKKKKNMWDF